MIPYWNKLKVSLEGPRVQEFFTKIVTYPSGNPNSPALSSRDLILEIQHLGDPQVNNFIKQVTLYEKDFDLERAKLKAPSITKLIHDNMGTKEFGLKMFHLTKIMLSLSNSFSDLINKGDQELMLEDFKVYEKKLPSILDILLHEEIYINNSNIKTVVNGTKSQYSDSISSKTLFPYLDEMIGTEDLLHFLKAILPWTPINNEPIMQPVIVLGAESKILDAEEAQ